MESPIYFIIKYMQFLKCILCIFISTQNLDKMYMYMYLVNGSMLMHCYYQEEQTSKDQLYIYIPMSNFRYVHDYM